MTMIASNLQAVHGRIDAVCRALGRDPQQLRLLAVSKTFGVPQLEQAFAAGQTCFGESYIQEAVGKIQALRHRAIEWHCIGPIQSNKTRPVAEHYDWVQSLDRQRIAQRLNEQRPLHVPPLQICLQVNIDGGANKSGVMPDELMALIEEVIKLPRLRLRGLMTIPEPAADFAAACAVHSKAKALFDQVNSAGVLAEPMDTLSMGMTADLEAAIAAGSSMVRVGTAIFGGR